MSKFDFYAAMATTDEAALKTALNSRQLDLHTYLVLLHASECRAGQRPDPDNNEPDPYNDSLHQRSGLSRYSRNMITDAGAPGEMLEQLGLRGVGAKIPDVLQLWGAVVLEFDFVLEKQYLSRDDSAFYPIENPLRKDSVFKVPMVSGSSWKGSLRAAAVENMLARAGAPESKQDERHALIDIFGDEKGNADEAPAPEGTLGYFLNEQLGPCSHDRRKGRLRCLSSYFDRIDLDVLNPRDRKSRAGTLPIFFEVAPAAASARFSLFYFPFDLVGDEQKMLKAQRRDWKLIGEAIYQMFRVSGFGAKKSNGCGKAQTGISNTRFEALAANQRKLSSLDQLPRLHEAFPEAA